MRVLLLSLIALLWGCSSIDSASSTNYPPRESTVAAGTVGVEAVFTTDEIKIIRAYYEANGYSGTKNGKYKRLPPGIAKNLQRGKPLPPGIAKQTLPRDLQRKLPEPPKGYGRVVVAGKVLLVELGTQIVRDILTDVAFG